MGLNWWMIMPTMNAALRARNTHTHLVSLDLCEQRVEQPIAPLVSTLEDSLTLIEE